MNSRWINNYLPALLWAAIPATWMRWQVDPLSLLMVLRVGVVAWCFWIRLPATQRAPRYQVAVSWLSALLPFAMRWHLGSGTEAMVGVGLVIVGTTLVCLGCIDLGESFGISPALRKPVTGGLYTWLPCPIYLGHFVTEVGILVASPSARNVAIAATGWTLYVVRTRWENQLITQADRSPGAPG